jgi:hypothetical protein
MKHQAPITVSAATIHEYKMVTPSLAKVTASIQPNAKRESILASITAALKSAGAPIAASFRKLNDTTIIGYVAASRETRPVESIADLAKDFRVLSSNMYLDNNDKTLWEMKEGASGKYLARNGVDDLESLVQASRVSPTGSIPRLNRVSMASVERHDLVAFVKQGPWTTDVDYGFCLSSNATGDAIVITDAGKQTVKSDFIIAAYQDDNMKVKKGVKSTVFNEPINTMKDYYKLAYGNQDGTGPGDAAQQEYVDKIITQIEEMGLS